ncbi:hypothetical protein FD754_024431 [Muntiacus muntjak]|uniref:DDE-1 domain-containing protein n=1 Tax=Muntiacus muntjak TaxID=9888 RepID=A0A5N3UPK4_MUNMU|nr:hypothetical protein FD754_024431 [Muntiacus muntjak]
MVKLLKKACQSQMGQKLSLLPQIVSQVVNAKEKVLKEIKSAPPKLSVDWTKDHNAALGQSLIQSKALALFNSMKAERDEDAAEKKLKAGRDWFMRFKERRHLPNIEHRCREECSIGRRCRRGLAWLARRSQPGFKDSKDRLTLLLGANAAGDLKLKPSLTYILKILGTFRIMLNLLRLCSYNEIHVVFTPANTASILQPTDQGVVTMLKSWYLGNSFCKAIAATNNDFEGFNNSMEEVIADVVEIARELELEVEPNVKMGLILTLMDEQRKWFLDIESTPGEDFVKIVEMTTKDLDYKFRINLVEKAAGGFERIKSNFERSSSVGLPWKQTEIILEESNSQISLLSNFQKLRYPPQPSGPPTLISQQP